MACHRIRASTASTIAHKFYFLMLLFRVWKCLFENNLSVLWIVHTVMNSPRKVSRVSHWIWGYVVCFGTNNPFADKHNCHRFLFANIVFWFAVISWRSHRVQLKPFNSFHWSLLSLTSPSVSLGPSVKFLEVRKQPRGSERGEWADCGSSFNIYCKNTNSYSNILKSRNASLNSANF